MSFTWYIHANDVQVYDEGVFSRKRSQFESAKSDRALSLSSASCMNDNLGANITLLLARFRVVFDRSSRFSLSNSPRSVNIVFRSAFIRYE